MQRNIIFTLCLIATLVGGLTSCTKDEMTEYNDPFDIWYQFDENGIPYRNPQKMQNDGSGGMGASQPGLISWSLVIGYDWEPMCSYIIQEDGSSRLLEESKYQEMNIYHQYYYLTDSMLTTTYRSPEHYYNKIAEYTEPISISANGSIYVDKQPKDSIRDFRLHIIDVMEIDGKIVMRAIEPLCIEYYGDDDQGRIVFGETTFQRSNHYKE